MSAKQQKQTTSNHTSQYFAFEKLHQLNTTTQHDTSNYKSKIASSI
jgi:hypothetical protein